MGKQPHLLIAPNPSNMGAGAPVAAGIRRNDNWVFPQQPLGLPSGWRIGDLTRPPQPRPCQSMDPSHELRTCIRGGGGCTDRRNIRHIYNFKDKLNHFPRKTNTETEQILNILLSLQGWHAYGYRKLGLPYRLPQGFEYMLRSTDCSMLTAYCSGLCVDTLTKVIIF